MPYKITVVIWEDLFLHSFYVVIQIFQRFILSLNVGKEDIIITLTKYDYIDKSECASKFLDIFEITTKQQSVSIFNIRRTKSGNIDYADTLLIQ